MASAGASESRTAQAGSSPVGGVRGGLVAWTAVLGLAVAGTGFLLPSTPVERVGGVDGSGVAEAIAHPDRTVPTGAVAPPADGSLIGKRTGDVLQIPSLSVDAPLVSISMSRGRELSPPRNPREVGYWDHSARPGASQGQTLITGHTVHTGGGALDRLGDLRTGSTVLVSRTQDGTQVSVTYRVTDVVTYSKAKLARNATRLFGQDLQHGRLVLVTCTGWDGRIYHGNTVVLAHPTGTTTRAT